ncbi:AraC family transcriptional regulator [Streptococcus merionis]
MEQYTDRFTDFNNKSISDLILYSSGIEHCKPGYSYELHGKDYHVIHFVREGCGTFTIEGVTYHIRPNQLFIIPAGYAFHYQSDNENPFQYCWFGFLGIKSNFIYQVAVRNQFVFECRDVLEYETIIREILRISDNSFSSFLKVNGLMYNLLGKLVDEISILDFQSKQTISALATHYMELHYHEPIQISDIASFVGLHPNYLANIFKKEQGISPKQYLINLKIKKAKELLIQTADPINIVAGYVGFVDALSFSKFFKTYTNQSPTVYRKENSHDTKNHV